MGTKIEWTDETWNPLVGCTHEYIERVFDVMLQTEHQFQILTKRPQRMAAWVSAFLAPALRETVLENIWLGTSIESNRYAFRADHLRETPAMVRFLSCEPLLGPLPDLDLTGIDWVIAGGESGPGARPMASAWVRDLRDRCVDAGVAFSFKQWGEWLPLVDRELLDLPEAQRRWDRVDDEAVVRVGKKAAGRVLDGRTWDEYPA
jgi:protein gp37